MSESMTNLRNKIILITGAAQGIGAATAHLCAERGARVIIADIQADKGEAVAAAIRAGGGDALFLPVDVRSAPQVAGIFDQIAAHYGRLDVLICAAGVLQGQYLQPEEFPLELFELIMDVNVKGTFLCAKAATTLLVASQGIMLLIASIAGVIVGSSSLAYGTSKGAVNGLGMTLAQHLAPRGVRVNVICPGNVNTEMKRAALQTQAEKEQRDFQQVLAQSELGEPIGVARLLAFLASEEGNDVRRNLFTR